MSINRFMAVDFSGFAKMVDALGGVEVCSTTPLRGLRTGHGAGHGGRQIIDGHTALNYVRARQVTTETNGDYGRIKRQQLFLSSLLRSLISKDTFFSLNKLNNVVNMFIDDSYVDNIKTKDLVELGQSLQGMAAGHITFVTVPTGVHRRERQRAAARRPTCARSSTRSSTTTRCPEENDQNAQNFGTSPTSGPTTAPTTKKTPPPSAATRGRNISRSPTTSPQDVTVRVSNATAQERSGGHRDQPAEARRLQCDDARRLPEFGERDDGVLLAGQRAGRGHGGVVVRQAEGPAGFRIRAGRSGGARPRLQLGEHSPTQRLVDQHANRTRLRQRPPSCPRT